MQFHHDQNFKIFLDPPPKKKKKKKKKTNFLNQAVVVQAFKAMNTFGTCISQRPVISLGVSKRMYKITNFDSFGHRSCKKIVKQKKHPCCTNLCAFRCIIKGFRPEVFQYLSEKLPLSQKLCYSAISHNVLLSTALHCSLPS